MSVCLCVSTAWTVVCQASGSMGFSGQEGGSGLPFPPPGDLSDPGIETMSFASPCKSKTQQHKHLLRYYLTPWFRGCVTRG